MIDFKLPDVGEGLTEAEILAWHVTVGAEVAVNQTLVEIETAKSVVELPSPVNGVIKAIHIEPGVTVGVGTVIVTIVDPLASTATSVLDHPSMEDTADVSTTEEQPLVLVGTGPKPAVARTVRLGKSRSLPQVTEMAPVPQAIRAKPPVRALARKLGVDLSKVRPSSGDIISRSDVELASRPESTAGSGSEGHNHRREVRIPIKGVRRATAAAMVQSAFTAPHVTEFLTIDVTMTMDLLDRLKADHAWRGVRLTPLVLVARALLLTIRRFPGINARWDEGAQEIVLPDYVNLGLAAATPRGLIVPNVKEAQDLTLLELANEIETLVATARAGKSTPEQMSKGTITITNIGALGVDTGTPILNTGEAAILAFGNVRDMPWVVDGCVVPRKVTQLALSFDHRLVDGELGSKVLSTLGRLLTDPSEAFTLS